MKKFLITILLAACSAEESAPQTAPKPFDVVDLSWRERVAADLAAGRTGPSVVLDRLARKVDSEEVRVSLVEALPRNGGIYADALADLFVDEGSVKVRAAFVRATPSEQILPIMRRAFADSSTEVRIVAVRTAASHPVCERLASELRTALNDSDAALRAEAAKSIGVLKIEAARAELVRALGDGNAEVRLEAMRALDTIAPGSLAGTAAVTQLRSDPDVRVAELAQKLAVRQ
ncbi:MAG: sister chromatid cohesion protein PDS5 [Myxococcota bacterium]|nr:sister chromatid cohesion protein PDS5 [Myxococcota bacterium]